MRTQLYTVLVITSLLLLSGCMINSAPAQPPPELVKHRFESVALLPVIFVNGQPDSFCHSDIGEDLRSALIRVLQRRGYVTLKVPDDAPQSFARGPEPPLPGNLPETSSLAPANVDAVMGIWVEDYLATTLCERFEPSQLDMTVLVTLYSSPEQEELGRWRAREDDMGTNSSQQTVWRVTGRLADRLTQAIPFVKR
jgi:hypothetical protein